MAISEREKFMGGEDVTRVRKYTQVRQSSELEYEGTEPFREMKDVRDAKKPRSAYNFFCFENQTEISKASGMFYRSLGRQLAVEWSLLSMNQKNEYQEMSNKDNQEWNDFHKRV
jgi:hypothetical protein